MLDSHSAAHGHTLLPHHTHRLTHPLNTQPPRHSECEHRAIIALRLHSLPSRLLRGSTCSLRLPTMHCINIQHSCRPNRHFCVFGLPRRRLLSSGVELAFPLSDGALRPKPSRG